MDISHVSAFSLDWFEIVFCQENRMVVFDEAEILIKNIMEPKEHSVACGGDAFTRILRILDGSE